MTPLQVKEACAARLDAEVKAHREAKLPHLADALQKGAEAVRAMPIEAANKIPADIAAAVLAIGKAEWGATAPKADAEHLADLTNTLRSTRDYFGTYGPSQMHGLYIESTSIVICHTGTSPNSAIHAQALTGAWNWLLDTAKAQAARDAEVTP